MLRKIKSVLSLLSVSKILFLSSTEQMILKSNAAVIKL